MHPTRLNPSPFARGCLYAAPFVAVFWGGLCALVWWVLR